MVAVAAGGGVNPPPSTVCGVSLLCDQRLNPPQGDLQGIFVSLQTTVLHCVSGVRLSPATSGVDVELLFISRKHFASISGTS